MKWYENSYINTRDWLLENLSFFDFNPNQVLIILLIDFYNHNHIDINNDLLARQTNLDYDILYEEINSLISKKYLKVYTSSNKVIFDISKVYEYEDRGSTLPVETDLVQLIGEKIGKPLTQNEIGKVAMIKKEVGYDSVIKALKIALINDKKSIDYIVAVARNNKDNAS